MLGIRRHGSSPPLQRQEGLSLYRHSLPKQPSARKGLLHHTPLLFLPSVFPCQYPPFLSCQGLLVFLTSFLSPFFGIFYASCFFISQLFFQFSYSALLATLCPAFQPLFCLLLKDHVEAFNLVDVLVPSLQGFSQLVNYPYSLLV